MAAKKKAASPDAVEPTEEPTIEETEKVLLVSDGAGTVVDTIEVEAPVEEVPSIVMPFTVGTWRRRPNYLCNECKFATLDKARIVEHVVAGHQMVVPDDLPQTHS